MPEELIQARIKLDSLIKINTYKVINEHTQTHPCTYPSHPHS